jgi:hypothetical protein
MHIVKIAALVVIGLFTATATANAQAADKPSSSIVGTLPGTEHNLQVVLFTLKDSKISLSVSPQDFCGKLDYGEAVFWDRPDEIKDHAVVPGNLNWVICKFKGR